MSGEWYYSEAPKDVYWMHGNCTCSVTYDPGTGKVQDVHTKAWSESSDAIDRRKQFSESSEKKEVVDKQQSRFNSFVDPMVNITGSAFESNPEETKSLIEQMDAIGGKIKLFKQPGL